jgi:hypothetical protein
VRFAWLTLLAGCQLAFPHESEGVVRECIADHDEDGDGTFDCDDPCPIKAGAMLDLDRDSDGVGEGCDPTPGIDRIAFYDPFVTNREYARFDGSLDGASALFGNRSGALLDLPLERFRVYVGFEIVDQASVPGGFGVVYGATLAPTDSERAFDGNYCQPYKSHEDADLLEFELWQAGQREGDPQIAFADWVGPDMPLTGFTGVLELDVADRLSCKVEHVGGPTLHSDERRVEPAGIAVYTFNASIRLAYLLVVEHGD